MYGFSHVMLYTNDQERAVRWYVEVLGFKKVFAHPGYAALEHTKFPFRLDLHPSEAGSKDVGFGPMPYFRTKNIEATLAELTAKGVKTSKARREGDSPLFATFWDCEGNALGLLEG